MTETAHAMIRLLSGLARKGAWLEQSEDGPILSGPGGRRRREGQQATIPLAVVDTALRQAWIARDGHRYRLTEAGALALHSGMKPPEALQASRAAASLSVAPQTPRSELPRPVRRSSAMAKHHMEAAERLAEDFQTGQMMPRVTSNWDRAALGALPSGARHPSGRGVEVSDRISAAQERVRRALTDGGPEFADVLIDLVCLDRGVEAFESRKGWPRRSAKLVLGLALERLARHYGIVVSGSMRGRTQHWGTGDFRPT